MQIRQYILEKFKLRDNQTQQHHKVVLRDVLYFNLGGRLAHAPALLFRQTLITEHTAAFLKTNVR